LDERRAAEARPEVRRVEDPDVGPPEAFRGQVRRRDTAVLAAVGGRDEPGFRRCPRRRCPAARRRRGACGRTRGGLEDTSTMLTLSERWFTTQTSPFVRAATATGSSPRRPSRYGSGSRSRRRRRPRADRPRVDGEEMATIGRQRERSHLNRSRTRRTPPPGSPTPWRGGGWQPEPSGPSGRGTSRADGLTITSSPADNNVFTRGRCARSSIAAAGRPTRP